MATGNSEGDGKKDKVCGADLKNMYGNCERKATIKRGEVWYCWQHDPERGPSPEEARKKRMEEFAAAEAKAEAQFERSRLERESGIRKLTNEQLEFIIAIGGINDILNGLQNN